MVTSNHKGIRKAGTVGIPLEDIKVRITSQETMEEVGEGQVGSLEIKGSNLFTGYWQIQRRRPQNFVRWVFYLW